MKRFETLQECIEQLEKCEFEDTIGHPLKNNVAFIQLEELSQVNNLRLPVVIKSCETCSRVKGCKIVNSCKSIGNKYCRFFENVL